MKKYGCSVYEDLKKLYQKDGCITSWRLGIKWDPFPGSPNTPVDTPTGKHLVFWEPKKCSDGKLRPLGIEECTYIWNEDKQEYDGECEQCGKCCMMGGPDGNTPCQYLIEINNDENILIDEVQKMKQMAW